MFYLRKDESIPNLVAGNDSNYAKDLDKNMIEVTDCVLKRYQNSGATGAINIRK